MNIINKDVKNGVLPQWRVSDEMQQAKVQGNLIVLAIVATVLLAIVLSVK